MLCPLGSIWNAGYEGRDRRKRTPNIKGKRIIGNFFPFLYFLKFFCMFFLEYGKSFLTWKEEFIYKPKNTKMNNHYCTFFLS